LLFKSNNLGSKLIRAATNSEYDHVAMIVKNYYRSGHKDKVFIFESVRTEGVRLTDWNYIRSDIGPGKFYEKVVYRRVDFNRDTK